MSELISPKNSFKGWSFFTLIEKNKKGIVIFFSMMLFLFLVGKMMVSATAYSVEEVILKPAAITGAFWTALQGFFYFRSERRK